MGTISGATISRIKTKFSTGYGLTKASKSTIIKK
jgi:hypothetical protein